jgi:outer membrane protein assembly factor BamB
VNTHRIQHHPAAIHRSPARFAGLPLLAILAILASGCFRTGERDLSADPAQLPAGSFTAAWRAEIPLEGKQLKQLTLNDEQVFALLSDNRCVWINRTSGRIASIAEAAKPQDTLFAPVTLADRVVFVSTSQLAVFDRKTTRLSHKNPLVFSASSGAVGDGHTVYLGEDNPAGGRVAAITTDQQPYEKSPFWELATRGQLSATPAVYQNMLFAGSRDGGVYAIRGSNRDNLWPGLPKGYFQTGGEIVANLHADKDGVYAASVDTKLYCLDINIGRLRWIYYAGVPLREASAPVVAGSSVYLYVPDTGMVALDKAGKAEIRQPKWVVPTARQFLASDDANVYLRTDDNTILAVDKATGQSRFSSRHNDFLVFATNTSAKDTNIYAATPAGVVYSITPVLKPGTVGQWVMHKTQLESVATK